MPKMTEAEMIAHNERALRDRQANAGFGGSEFGRPRDQYWVLRRGWNGETYFVPGSESPLVESQYNPLDALKTDE
jgi:hypothetical protein